MTKPVFTVVSACIGLLVALPFSARGDVTYSGEQNELEVIRMTVTPAAEPIPALKYPLLPRDIDLIDGNAAPYYYRMLTDFRRVMDFTRKRYDEEEELNKWYSTGKEAIPVDQLPLEKVRDAVKLTVGDYIEDQLNEAVKRRDCDWQLGVEKLRGMAVVNYSLEEFQISRQVARMLALKTRLAISERRYGDAVDTIRMNYRLGRDVARPPFLVCGLIGIAIDGITNGTLIELIAAPDSPNLYWSLTELPQPLIDTREAARFELDFGPRMFPFLNRPVQTDHSPQEWNRLFTQAIRDLQSLGGSNHPPQNDLEAGLAATGVALLGYSHAKAQLIAEGMDRDSVERMAVGQVLAIYTEQVYRKFADDWVKLWYVPFSESRKRAEALENRLRAAQLLSGGEDREVIPLVNVLLPAIQAVRNAQVRLERDMAALRVIEALRMYAAEHEGKLPESLEEVTNVPLPLNPATGKPFLYRLEDATGILELPKSDRITGSTRRFEIQIAAKK